MPSILNIIDHLLKLLKKSFKPYYNWDTFNTLVRKPNTWRKDNVLNLIISGLPSIRSNPT